MNDFPSSIYLTQTQFTASPALPPNSHRNANLSIYIQKKEQIDLSFSQKKDSSHKRKKKHKVDFNKLFVIHHTGDDCEFLVWIYLVLENEFGKMTILSKINENTRVKEASIIN